MPPYSVLQDLHRTSCLFVVLPWLAGHAPAGLALPQAMRRAEALRDDEFGQALTEVWLLP